MLLSYALRAVQVTLAAACLYMGYVGVSPILSAASIAETRIPPVAGQPERDLAFDRYQVIGSRNLFKSNAPPPPPQPVVEQVKETKLNFKLHGTLASDPTEFSVAVIENLDRRERVTVAVEDFITDGVKLVSVERRRVLIDNKGARESITMDEESEAQKHKKRVDQRRDLKRQQEEMRRRRIAPSAVRQSRPPRPNPAERVRDMKAEADALRELDEMIKPNLRAVLNGATMIPHFSAAGEFGGVLINGAQPGGPFDGMEDGTICSEINGAPMAGMQSLPQSVSEMDEGSTCIKCRTPGGAEITRCL